MFKKSAAISTVAVMILLLLQFAFPVGAADASAELICSGTITAGGSAEVTLSVDTDMLSGAQVDLTLPDGVTVKSAECLADGWQVEPTGDITDTLVAYAPKNSTLSGENRLIKILFTADKNLAIGTELKISAAVKLSVSDGNGKYTTLPQINTECAFTVSACDHSRTQESVAKRPKSGEEGVIETRCLDCGALVNSRTFTVKYGDADGDGNVNASDAIWVLRLNAGLITDATLEQRTAADVDESGIPDSQDAIMILRYNAQLLDRFPAE